MWGTQGLGGCLWGRGGGGKQFFRGQNSLDFSDIFFFFFCSGAGEREEASEEVAVGAGFKKNEGRGGGVPRRT